MENNFYGVIYKITNLTNGKIYVGQSKNPKQRWNRHKYNSKKNKQRDNSLVSQAIYKYGEENFTFEIIISAKTQEELNWLEEKYIKELNSLSPNGYNLLSYNCGTNISSDETKNKMRKSRSNKKMDNSSSKYLGVTQSISKKTWKSCVIFKSKHINLGTFLSESDAAKARDIEVLKEEYGGIFELNFPELREKYLSGEITVEKIIKNIPCRINNIEYSSVAEASKFLGIPHSTLLNKLKNNNMNIELQLSNYNNTKKQCTIDGISYNSITEASKKLNINLTTLSYRLRKFIQ
jgi:group I intron endonuclease